MTDSAYLLTEDFDPKELSLFKQTCTRIEAAVAVANDFAESGEIKDQASCDRAAEVLTLVKDVHKELEDNRTASTRLLRERRESIDSAFKEIRGPVEGIIEAINQGIGNFNRKVEAQAAELQAKLDQEAADAQAEEDEEAAAEGRESQEIRPPQVIPETTRQTKTGSVAGTKIRKYRVTNFAELPDEFKKEDKGALNRAAKGGCETVPGVEFYYDHGTSVRKS